MIYCYKVINKIVSTKILVIRTNLTPTKVTRSNLYIRKIEIVPLRKAEEVAGVQSPGKSQIMVISIEHFHTVRDISLITIMHYASPQIQDMKNRTAIMLVRNQIKVPLPMVANPIIIRWKIQRIISPIKVVSICCNSSKLL